MSYRATSFILNCGPSMETRLPGHDKTAFQDGLEIIMDAVSEKILSGRKTDKMNIVLSGTLGTNNELADESPDQYQHVTTMCPLDQPGHELLHQLVNLTSNSDRVRADIMDALILSIHILVKNFGHLRYAKQIVLITDAADPIDWRDVDTVSNMLQAKDIKLVVIGSGFDADGIIKDEDEDSKSVAIKTTNQQEWKKLVQSNPGATIHSVAEALESARGMKTAQVKSTTGFRGFLNIGDTTHHPDRSLAISVHMYPHMMEAKPPTAKKWSTLSNLVQHNPSSSDPPNLSHTVEAIRKYVVKNSDFSDDAPDDSSHPVDENALEKVYSFGKTLVKISGDEEAYLRLETSPGMWVIGFYSKSAVPRDYFMSRVSLVVGDPNDRQGSGVAVAALARSLYEKDAVALIRMVRRNNGEPEIGILSPFIDVDVNLLQYCQIPFAEDMRQYTFNSLDRVITKSGKIIDKDHPLLPTQEMKDAMSDYVKLLDLTTDDNDYYSPEDTFNPLIWRFNTAIKARALNEAAPIPKLHPKLEQDMSMLPKLETKSADQVKKMISLFDIKKVEEKTPQKRRYGGSSEAASETLAPIDRVIAGEETTKRARTEPILSIGTTDPVQDFNAMLNNEEQDLVTAAVTQMTALILRLATTSFGDQHYRRIITCLKECRQAAAKENEAGLFNTCLVQLKQLVNPSNPTSPRLELWHLIQKESIRLISQDEADDDEVANVTKEDAINFLNDDMEQQVTVPADENNEMSTEDLLAMME